jgi:CRP/FNR family transcriptional regulator, cyclic AMP receptor protein
MLKKICKLGEVIFREGDESTGAYWITSGRVEITIRSGNIGLPVARLGPGEIIGEMGLIDNKPRSATATALGPTELEVITEEEFEKDVLHEPARLRTYIGRLFERLRATDTLLELERRRQRTSAPAATPTLPPVSKAESGPEPVVTLKSVAPNPVTKKIITADVDRFPFRIGRAGDKWSPFFQNELLIEDENPLQISRQHASIDHGGGGKCFISDRGSRMGTVVNGVQLGVSTDTMVAELKTGDNTVIFGHAASSPHRYTVNVSAPR